MTIKGRSYSAQSDSEEEAGAGRWLSACRLYTSEGLALSPATKSEGRAGAPVSHSRNSAVPQSPALSI